MHGSWAGCRHAPSPLSTRHSRFTKRETPSCVSSPTTELGMLSGKGCTHPRSRFTANFQCLECGCSFENSIATTEASWSIRKRRYVLRFLCRSTYDNYSMWRNVVKCGLRLLPRIGVESWFSPCFQRPLFYRLLLADAAGGDPLARSRMPVMGRGIGPRLSNDGHHMTLAADDPAVRFYRVPCWSVSQTGAECTSGFTCMWTRDCIQRQFVVWQATAARMLTLVGVVSKVGV